MYIKFFHRFFIFYFESPWYEMGKSELGFWRKRFVQFWYINQPLNFSVEIFFLHKKI
jgi:hypothetical protein